MNNFRLKLCFDGSNYHGFQIQPNASTIQGTLNSVLSSITGEYISITGCSRTDAGVHAKEYYANFKSNCAIPPENLKRALNSLLPSDIAVLDCQIVDDSFNSRFDVAKKEYVYRFFNGSVKNPFLKSTALFYPYKLDEKIMDEACKHYIGEHDFRAFMAQGSDVTDTVRTIYSSKVIRNGDIVEFYVEGNGFLYNMVRIMAGTLLYINEGKISLENLDKIILSQDRKNTGKTLPPHALFLNKVTLKA
ncbi:MAG: tRNA pseudouridine(38-40) synthase TruA [Ruminococcaceae bacterium]|nr:tRNA pseudouridine(38-40) synthase TruA [Oscillospiraceae bacterium]